MLSQKPFVWQTLQKFNSVNNLWHTNCHDPDQHEDTSGNRALHTQLRNGANTMSKTLFLLSLSPHHRPEKPRGFQPSVDTLVFKVFKTKATSQEIYSLGQHFLFCHRFMVRFSTVMDFNIVTRDPVWKYQDIKQQRWSSDLFPRIPFATKVYN